MTIPGGGDNVVTEAEEIQAAMLCVVISIFCSSMGYIYGLLISVCAEPQQLSGRALD